MLPELNQELDISLRLLLAAVLGGLVGFEREIHEHPAGMRTHLLVSLGSAIFTVLSIFAFQLPPGPDGAIRSDPARVAAQVVSGIGFLGAGAILKYGTTVRGLTTAASLWATAAVGMAAAAGSWLVAIVGTLIILASLWPLHWVVERFLPDHARRMRVQLGLRDLADLSGVMSEIHRRRLDILAMDTDRLGKGRYEVSLQFAVPPGAIRAEIIGALQALPGISVLSSDLPPEG